MLLEFQEPWQLLTVIQWHNKVKLAKSAIAAYSSFAGGTIAAIFLLIAAPSLSKVSLAFRSPDYFGLMILGLTAVSAFSAKVTF